MVRPSPPVAWLLACLLGAASASAQDGAALYTTHCARCHGVDGDGQGTEQLDRPARSFALGGFSFGDTEEAIVRTITHGIPGSPMPSFGEATSEAERVALARHVATLMPPRVELLEGQTLLEVGDHAVVVRGHLPPIAEGAPDHPRGLLVGLPSGFTFQYRTDDLALLGIRQGQLAKRTDWAGRGGTPLEPLGQVVWLNDGGTPRSEWETWDAEPLHRELVALSTPADGPPRVESLLRDGTGTTVARVTETLEVAHCVLGLMWRRRLTVEPQVERGLALRWLLRSNGGARGGWHQGSDGQLLEGQWIRRDDGASVVAMLKQPFPSRTGPRQDGVCDLSPSEHDGPIELTLDLLVTRQWSDDDQVALHLELAR